MVLIYNSTAKSDPSNIDGTRANSQESTGNNYLELFIRSREAMGASHRTLQFYMERLSKIFSTIDCTTITRGQIHEILNSIAPNKYGLSTRHASYRALKTFYRWLLLEYGILNPMDGMPAPILSRPILPTLTLAQVRELLEKSTSLRARAIIALFVESGLRLTELSNLRWHDIDWESRTVKVIGKGRKEAEAPFGQLTEKYLKAWLKNNRSKADANGNIWGINSYGIVSMLRRLAKTTGITCNAHVFRRTFACLLRKAGVDHMIIQSLGRWESIAMVQRYTRAFTFKDSLQFYKAPLGQVTDGGHQNA